jgi:type IV pilus assembly protein PilA
VTFFSPTKAGFTLIEIMIVIGIIALLAAFAIPQMLRSRMNANELAAIAALRTISDSCQSYYNAVVPHTYPTNLSDLTFPNSNPSYVDPVLANAVDPANTKQGYYFSYTLLDSEHFTVIAWPGSFGRTGTRNLFVNELGTITYNKEMGLAPNIDDLVVQ